MEKGTIKTGRFNQNHDAQASIGGKMPGAAELAGGHSEIRKAYLIECDASCKFSLCAHLILPENAPREATWGPLSFALVLTASRWTVPRRILLTEARASAIVPRP